MKEGTKLVCIKTIEPYVKGETYVITKSANLMKSDGSSMEYLEVSSMLFFVFKEDHITHILNFFIPLAEFREKRINNILK